MSKLSGSSIMALRALPSSSSTCGWTYDVFLSFRGKDTRMTFTGNLYNALNQRGIRTFFDDEELKRGEEIKPSLVKAIKESRIAIIVFSQNFASSSFCLDELVTILEHFKGKDELVWPVFYNVDPAQIRHCRGSFKDSLAKHEERFKHDKEKVLKWRFALQNAANLSGDHLKSGYKYEYEFVGKIVEEVSRKINHDSLHVADNPVGLELPMIDVISLLELELDDIVKMIGIYGTGGIGKSTIARAVYNYIAHKFEGICFLDDVRAHGPVQMQKKLLSKAVGERNIQLDSVNEGISLIKRRLQNKKILVVLDNVDKLNQLKMIAGGTDWFGKGSRVIITTRDKGLLVNHGVNGFYEVQGLNHEKALELFSWNAFKSHKVDLNFLELSNRMVRYADGLPLALEVIGSHLACKGRDEWSSTLEKYESISEEKIDAVLKVSYDGLGEHEKEIFLDIACCFKGMSFQTIKDMLAACYSCSISYSINALVEKCLLKNNRHFVTMHDLIQRMGKDIVRRESTKDFGKHSRLWYYKDVVHVLKNKRGSDKIEVIVLDPPEEIEVKWDGKAFEKMENLRILIIRKAIFSTWPKHLPYNLRVLKWWKYPSPPSGSPFPCDFQGEQLVILELPYSCCRWDKQHQDFQSLTQIDFHGCNSLQQIPDLSSAMNLKELILDYCENLSEIHESIGSLRKLEIFSAEDCIKLSIFPSVVTFPALQYLNLENCQSLRSFPEVLEENNENLTIKLDMAGIEELPSSVQKLRGIVSISLISCESINRLPSCILTLPQLTYFNATCSRMFHFFDCSKGLEKVELSTIMSEDLVVDLSKCYLEDEFFHSPICVSSFYQVVRLDLSHNNFTVLPICFEQFHFLKMLLLDYCKQLREIEGIPPNVLYISATETPLSSKSSNMSCVTQVTSKADRLLILSGRKVPGWFDYSCHYHILTFWFRKKAPMMTFCFEGLPQNYLELAHSDISTRINGIMMYRNFKGWGDYEFSSLENLDVLAFYSLDFNELCNGVRLSENEWNCVEIIDEGYNMEWIDDIGVYVNKEKTSMEDIRFDDPFLALELNPLPLKKRQYTLWDERLEDPDNLYESMEFNSFFQLPRKKQCTLSDMEACETSDTITQWAKELCLNTHNNLDSMNWDSTSNVPVIQQDMEARETLDTQQQQHSTSSNTMTQWAMDLCLSTHSHLDAINWGSTSSIPAWSIDTIIQQDMKASETSDTQQQQHSTSSNSMTQWAMDLCLSTHNHLDAINRGSTSNIPAWSIDTIIQQDPGHEITDFVVEGMEVDKSHKMMHLDRLQLKNLLPMKEDELASNCSSSSIESE